MLVLNQSEEKFIFYFVWFRFSNPKVIKRDEKNELFLSDSDG